MFHIDLGGKGGFRISNTLQCVSHPDNSANANYFTVQEYERSSCHLPYKHKYVYMIIILLQGRPISYLRAECCMKNIR